MMINLKFKIINLKLISNLSPTQTGFTLIELILYMAILTIMLSALIPFAWSIIQTNSKSSTQQEVSGNARYISELLKYSIRNSIGINSVSATSISLIETLPAENPTVFDLSAGKIRIKKGASAVVNLNSVDTTISSLVFTNYTSADSRTKNIQFNFTINLVQNGTTQAFVQSMVVEGDGEVRSN